MRELFIHVKNAFVYIQRSFLFMGKLFIVLSFMYPIPLGFLGVLYPSVRAFFGLPWGHMAELSWWNLIVFGIGFSLCLIGSIKRKHIAQLYAGCQWMPLPFLPPQIYLVALAVIVFMLLLLGFFKLCAAILACL